MIIDRDRTRLELGLSFRVQNAVAGQLGRRIEDSLAVLVDGIAEEKGSPDQGGLALELILEDDGLLLEGSSPQLPLHLVTFEVIDVQGRRHAILLGRHTETIRSEERQHLVAELIVHRHEAMAEGLSWRDDRIAVQMSRRIGDAFAVLIDRIAEAERSHHRRQLRIELIDERHLARNEVLNSALRELVTLEVVRRGRRNAVQHPEEETPDREAPGYAAPTGHETRPVHQPRGRDSPVLDRRMRETSKLLPLRAWTGTWLRQANTVKGGESSRKA